MSLITRIATGSTLPYLCDVNVPRKALHRALAASPGVHSSVVTRRVRLRAANDNVSARHRWRRGYWATLMLGASGFLAALELLRKSRV